MEELTAKDILKLLGDRARWCREEGESDMRYITHMAKGISEDINKGLSREEILERWESSDV